jgi:hypothetical protein
MVHAQLPDSGVVTKMGAGKFDGLSVGSAYRNFRHGFQDRFAGASMLSVDQGVGARVEPTIRGLGRNSQKPNNRTAF